MPTRREVNEEAGPAEVGATVLVQGVLQRDRSVLARVIKVLRPPQIRFTGEIRGLPPTGVVGDWVVGERTVIVATHHPVASHGWHGGFFTWQDH